MVIGNISRNISFQTVFNDSIENTFTSLNENGYTGIELNLPDLYNDIAPDRLRYLLDSRGLSMHYLATGAYAKQRQFSLSSVDETLRQASVSGLMDNIAYASKLGCGVIVGFFKGSACESKDAAKDALLRSVRQVTAFAEDAGVTILLEVTNSKETSVLTTLQEGADFVDIVASANIRLLADTYHMNLEEENTSDIFGSYLKYIPHIHLSDDNRLLPGFGSLDFKAIIQKLDTLGYSGTFAIEGNIKENITEDLKNVSQYFRGL